MKVRYSILLVLLACAFASCCGRKGAELFEPREREIITQSDSVMYVYVVDNPDDSLLLRGISRDLSDRELQSELYRTLERKMLCTVQSPEQDGVGIAAPQVGLLRRIVALQRFDKEGEPFEVYPNLHILEHVGDTVRGPEGCLSIPGKRGIVPRSEGVIVRWTDPQTLQAATDTVHGFTAIIFQHETDHLDGILYTDRADSVSESER